MERLYLKGITKLSGVEEREDYPFEVPVIRELDTLEFTRPVTIFCGNNGCGKTTLLELLAAKLSAVRISEVFRDQEKEKAFQKAERAFRIWRERPAKRNFYPFSARRLRPLRSGMNCVRITLDKVAENTIIKSVEKLQKTDKL